MPRRPPVRVLDRALAILATFSEERPRLGLSDVSRALRLSKATVLRLLRTLEAHGIVRQRPEDRTFALGPGAVRLGTLALRHAGLLEVSRPHLRQLQALSGETACLFMVSGADRVCVDVMPSQHPLRMTLEVGATRPLHAGAAGKVLLAFLPEAEARRILYRRTLPRLAALTVTSPARLSRQLEAIRQAGHAVSHDEAVAGAAAIAAPVFDRDGSLVAAVNLLGPRSRISGEVAQQLVPAVVKAAHAISRELGAHEVARPAAERARAARRRRSGPAPHRRARTGRARPADAGLRAVGRRRG
jgi:DNA-binding IclR family transcriptional regulator